MNPLAALTFNDTLGTEDHAVLIRLGEGLKNGLNFLHSKLLGSLLTERGEDLVGMVMVVVMVVTATVAMLIVIMVMMLVVVMLMTSALAMLVMIVAVMLVVVMLMTSALTVLIMVMVAMLVVVMLMTSALTVLIVIVVMMLMIMVTVTSALTVLIVIVVMVMMVMMLFLESLYRILNGILMLHSKENVLTVKEIPGSSHDNGLRIVLTKERNALGNLLILGTLCMGENDRGSVLNLVVIELAKVLHIHLALINVGNGGKAVKMCAMILSSLGCADNVRELTNSRGLDDDSIGIILLKYLNKSLGKIANKRAADTAGVHLGNLDTCIGKEAAVYTDLAKLVLNENNLLTCVCLFNQLLDKRGFTCAKEAGKYINLCHCKFTSEQYFYK